MDDMTDQARQSNQDDGITLLSVRRQHNNTVLINSLPNELLAHIFSVGVLCEARGLSWDLEPTETAQVPRIVEVASHLPAGSEPFEGVGKLRDWGAKPQTQDLSPKYPVIQVVASHVCSRWRECSLATPLSEPTSPCPIELFTQRPGVAETTQGCTTEVHRSVLSVANVSRPQSTIEKRSVIRGLRFTRRRGGGVRGELVLSR